MEFFALSTILTETTLTITEAAKTGFPRPVHKATIWRWILKGCRLPNKERLRLEAVRIGSQYVTSREAISRFITAQTEARFVTDTPTPRTPTQRARASDRASKKLESMGI